MTNVLLAIAILLFACLLGFGVFCLFIYLYEKEQEKWNDRTDEIKAEPGKYHKLLDIDSMHPSSCVSDSPFSYRYNGGSPFVCDTYSQAYTAVHTKGTWQYVTKQIDNRIDKLVTRIEEIETMIEDEEEPDTTLVERITRLEQQLEKLKSDYEKRFESIAESLNDIREELEEK